MYKKNHDKLIFAILCVESPNVQYIGLSETVYVVKDDIIVVCVHVVDMVMYDFIMSLKQKKNKI